MQSLYRTINELFPRNLLLLMDTKGFIRFYRYFLVLSDYFPLPFDRLWRFSGASESLLALLLHCVYSFHVKIP